MLVSRTFHELRNAETRLFRNHVHAGSITLRQALRRKLEACIVQSRFRHQHDAGPGIQLVLDSGGAQRLGNRARRLTWVMSCWG
jgi:hypothetical protein